MFDYSCIIHLSNPIQLISVDDKMNISNQFRDGLLFDSTSLLLVMTHPTFYGFEEMINRTIDNKET